MLQSISATVSSPCPATMKLLEVVQVRGEHLPVDEGVCR